MPSSLQARITRNAISPRLAIRTFSNMNGGARPPAAPHRYPGDSRASTHTEKDLTELHRLAVFGHHFGDDTARFCFDFVHHFHRLDNTNYRLFSDGFSNVDKRRA